MASFIFSDLLVLGQIGTTIALGLLFDTLIVRSFMTPSIAALLGRWFWWPVRVRQRPTRTARGPGIRDSCRCSSRTTGHGANRKGHRRAAFTEANTPCLAASISRAPVRTSMSFYGSTPNYALIWEDAGFEGTTARIREKQKAGDFKGMAAQITDEHIATFAIESTWDDLANALIEKYVGITTRIVLYNALGDRERFERYGAVAQRISTK